MSTAVTLAKPKPNLTARQLRHYIRQREAEIARIKKGLGVQGETITRYDEKKRWEEKATEYGVALEQDLAKLRKQLGDESWFRQQLSAVSCAIMGTDVCQSRGPPRRLPVPDPGDKPHMVKTLRIQL